MTLQVWYIVVMQGEKKNVLPYVIGAFLVVLLGVGMAWILSTKVLNGSNEKAAPGVSVTSKEAGKLDPNVKYDTATGILQKGGINGEGTYHLVRDGGAAKYVYLTSSMIDLGMFVDKKVEIWGETLASKKAGWLMDVAKVQVTE
jgi:hypothetical protein